MVKSRTELLNCLRKYAAFSSYRPPAKTEGAEEYRKISLMVSKISSFRKLVHIYRNTPEIMQEPVRARIFQVLQETLPAIFDFDELAEMWRSISSFLSARWLIEERIAQILPGILPGICDLLKLIEMREGIFNPSQGGMLIEKRMVELINGINASKIPDWFGPFISNPSNTHRLPHRLQALFDQKTEELRESLEPSF